jgi:hypothetical protein
VALMGYAPITDAESAAGRPVTSSLLARLRDNPRYIAEGDANAPKIANAAFTDATINGSAVVVDSLDGVKFANDSVTDAKIASGAIHLSQLKLGTGVHTVTVAASGVAVESDFSDSNYKYMLGMGSRLVGYDDRYVHPDQRQWWHEMGSKGTVPHTNTSVSSGVWGKINSGVVGDYIEIAVFYLSASPPYDLGNGEAGLFVFAKLDAAGNILATSASEDPPWSGIVDGHTYKRDGRLYVRPWLDIAPQDIRNHGKREAVLAKLRSGNGLPAAFQLDAFNKNRHKNRLPHPFGELKPGERVVLIDPASEMAHDLLNLKRAGASIGDLLHRQMIALEPFENARHVMPDGVHPVRGVWVQKPEEGEE